MEYNRIFPFILFFVTVFVKRYGKWSIENKNMKVILI